MRQISFVFLWLLIFIMPWEEMFVIPGLASFAKLLGISTFLFGLTSVIISGRVRFPIALVWFALFIGFCIASFQWAPDKDSSWRLIQTYVLLLTFVWLICSLADNPKRLKSLMRALVLGTAVMVVNMYFGYVHAGVALNFEGEARFSAERVNANSIATFCCLGILFAFYLITRRERTGFELPNWFYWGFFVAAGLAIPLSGSRAGVLSSGIAGLVLLGRLRRVNWKVRLGFVVAAVIIAIMVPRLVGSSTMSRFTEEGMSAEKNMNRITAWQLGLKAWVETPLFGVGVGGYMDTLVRMGHPRLVAHNTFISVLVECGLVGFVIYFSIWANVIRRILLLPKADRFFWLGVIVCYLPQLATGSAEYQKIWWFLGAMVLCQAVDEKSVAVGRRQIMILPPWKRWAVVAPRPCPHPLESGTNNSQGLI